MPVTNVGAKPPSTRLLVYDPQQNTNRVATSEDRMKATTERIKVVDAPMSAAERQSRLDVQAAMDKGFIESHIRPTFEKKAASEAQLKALSLDTSLTNEEKTGLTIELQNKITSYDFVLNMFKGSSAYNTFLLENSTTKY